jgi:hypothetical protein
MRRDCWKAGRLRERSLSAKVMFVGIIVLIYLVEFGRGSQEWQGDAAEM